MKDHQYYERLISESLDRQLSEAEAEELKQALSDNEELARFQRTVIKQAEIIRSLPGFNIAADLKMLPQRVKSPSFFRSLWKARISLPIPAAVILALVIVGIGLYGMFTSRNAEVPKTMPSAQEINYVQIERLKPAKAVLIQPSRDNGSTHKEGL